MKFVRSLLFSFLAAPLAWSAPAANPADGGDAILREMCARLASAKTMQFHLDRELDAPLAALGQPEFTSVDLAVQRPNLVSVRSKGTTGDRRLVADGRTLTLAEEHLKFYAVVPMKTNIDGLPERLEKQYGFSAPVVEFILSDPYRLGFKRVARKVTYGGRVIVARGLFQRTECDRLLLTGDVADAELWVSVKDRLPQRLIATFKRVPGGPQLRLWFSGWNLQPTFPANEFVYTPPAGAERVTMRTSAELERASKPARKKG